MMRHTGFLASLMLLMVLFSPWQVRGDNFMQQTLEGHDPQQEAVQPLETQRDVVASAGAGGLTEQGRTDYLTGILDRLTKILERLVNIFDRLVKIAKGGGSPTKPADKPATKPDPTPTPNPGTTSGGSAYKPTGSLNPKSFGYDERYQPVYDIIQKYCEANQKYVFAAGHTFKGYTGVTDCSGFTGHFYQMLAQISGVPPAFAKNSWFPSSQVYKTQYTKKITGAYPPPNPRDLIKPGDIFVLDKDGKSCGHIGVFVGYDKSGNPLIAHSTPTTIKSNAVSGKAGLSGVRIEPMPTYYRDRWSGIYRINGTDQMLDKLAKK